MTKAGQGKTRALKAVPEANRDEPRLDTAILTPKSLIGSPTPRIHSRLNDLPSKGDELIAFAESCGIDLMPWQRFVIHHAHKIKEDQRWAASEICNGSFQRKSPANARINKSVDLPCCLAATMQISLAAHL